MNKKQLGRRKIKRIVTIIGIVVLLGAGCIIYWLNLTKTSQDDAKSVDSNIVEVEDSNKVYDLTSLGLSFSYPSDWTIYATYPNGATLKSADFSSDTNNHANISHGSLVTISNAPKSSVYTETDESLRSSASNTANGQPENSEFVDVAEHRAIKFNHSSGGNRNTHTIVLFVKDNQLYTIDQQYELGSANPYPDLISTIVSTLEFLD